MILHTVYTYTPIPTSIFRWAETAEIPTIERSPGRKSPEIAEILRYLGLGHFPSFFASIR